MADINTAIGDLQSVLQGVDGIGRVDTRWGGRVTWTDRRRPAQAYWVITWSGYSEQAAGVGPQAFQRPAFRIRGWMPFSHENPDTTPIWYDLVEAVLDALRSHRSISQSMGLPQVVVPPDTIELLGDERTEEVACHHVVIEVVARRHITYTTE